MRTSILSVAFVALVALVGVAMFSSSVCARPGSGSGGGAALRIEGIVSSVNLSTRQIVLRKSTGAFVVIQTTTATTFERNGLHVTINRIKVGDRGQARLLANRLASKFESRGN